MIKIAICDDEPIYVDMISEAVREAFVQQGAECQIDTYGSGKDILDAIEEKIYDLILLDIQMPEVSGFDVAQEIYHITRGDNLVFVSNEEHLVCASLDFRPQGFIRKRLLKEETNRVISRWYERYQVYKSIYVNIKCQYGNIQICSDDIMYIESKGHYVYVHTIQNVYKSRGKLSEYRFLLDKIGFVRCSASYICNLRHICRLDLTYGSVKLKNDVELPISRIHKGAFRKKYLEYEIFGDI